MRLDINSVINIVLPENAMATELFAGKELAKYIKKSFGITPRISDFYAEGEYNFIIGSPMRNKAASEFVSFSDFCLAVPGPEGLYVGICGNDVLLAGTVDNDGYDVGNLYAVYEFLERYIGCCFGAYTKQDVSGGEIVPTHSELVLENCVYTKEKADLCYRTAIVQYNNWVGDANHQLTPAFIDWLAKNRYNRILTWYGIYKQYCDLGLIGELKKRGIRLTVGHHQAIATWLPPYGNEEISKKYAVEHPEFYRLNADGTRYKPESANDYGGQMILCCRNENLIAELAKNINEWLTKNPLVDTIAFWPNDRAEPICCCEKCLEYSKVENYLYFENELAKKVTAVHPHVKIDVLVYMDLWDCPDNLELCDGIRIDESTWAADGLRACGKPDGTCLVGTKFEENLMRYRKICKNTVFYEYYMGNYGNLQRIMPAADEMQAIYKHFTESGISGSGTQIECFNIWNNLLNFYCFARTAYDTSLSLAEQIKRITCLFGAGASYTKKIFEIYEATLNGQVRIDETGEYFAANVDKNTVYELFEKALDMAENKTCANNIKLLRMAFRYTDLSCKNEKTSEELKELFYMYTQFNSFLVPSGYGIAIPKQEKADGVINDRWYML